MHRTMHQRWLVPSRCGTVSRTPASWAPLPFLEPAALGGDETFRSMIRSYWRVAHEHELVDETAPPEDLW